MLRIAPSPLGSEGDSVSEILLFERGRFLPSQALLERLADAVAASPEDLVRRRPKKTKPSLRPSEARLLALAREMTDAEIDDLIRGVKLIMKLGRS